MNLFFDFTIDKENQIIRVKREFAAPLKLVWDAWTQAKYLDQWWAAQGWKGQTISMEFKEGGRRHYRMDGPQGELFYGVTSYDKINLHQDYEGKELFADKEGNADSDYPQSVYTIVFQSQKEHTFIEHVTTYPDMEQLQAAIKYGFKDGCINAYSLLDELLVKS